MRVLVVEDDPLLGDGLAVGLRQRGFATDWVRDGVAAEAAMQAEAFGAMVLDLGLPRMSGQELLRRRRAAGDATPVLILTARDGVADRVHGLDAGADDYVVKPVDLDELAARLRALVRRAAGHATATLDVGDLHIDPSARTVTWRGEPVDLSPREFALLHELASNAGRALSRNQLEQRLYAWGEEIGSNAIEVHVHHLRRKLDPGLILTLRGTGYLVPKPA
jgi:two-component system OmpR family response regulator/two-component system response regulator QseB